MTDDEGYRGWRVVEGPGEETVEASVAEDDSDYENGPSMGEIPEHTGPNAIAGTELFPDQDEESDVDAA